MKKSGLAALSLAVVGGLVWFVWFKPRQHEDEEKKPATEVPVHLGKITRRTVRAHVTVYGVIEPEPSGERPPAGARVAASVPGVVATVKCAEGQQVEKGALLFQLDSRAADVAVDKARKTAEFADKNLERQKKLMQVDGTSQKLLLEAEQASTVARNELAAAQTQQALLQIQAPLAATVTRVNVKPGEAVDLTTVLAEVIDLDRLVVSASVPSTELALLKPGQPAEVQADKSAAPVSSSIVFISPQVDPKTGTAFVRAALPAKSGLRPGQFVTLRIVSEEHKDRLVVPADSVVKDSEDATVIALVDGDKATLKPVKAGLHDGDLIEVEGEGLKEGMTVVTEGAYGLPKETKVRDLAREAEPKDKKTEKPEPGKEK
jgi:membrane fusion protein, multidrug efflux system